MHLHPFSLLTDIVDDRGNKEPFVLTYKVNFSFEVMSRQTTIAPPSWLGERRHREANRYFTMTSPTDSDLLVNIIITTMSN